MLNFGNTARFHFISLGTPFDFLNALTFSSFLLSYCSSTSGTDPANSLDLILLDPAKKDGSAASGLDLLSGDNGNNESGQDSLALVPVGDSQPLDPSEQNAIVLSQILPQEGSNFDPQSLQSEAYVSNLPQNPDDPHYTNGYPGSVGLSQDQQQEEPGIYSLLIRIIITGMQF